MAELGIEIKHSLGDINKIIDSIARFDDEVRKGDASVESLEKAMSELIAGSRALKQLADEGKLAADSFGLLEGMLKSISGAGIGGFKPMIRSFDELGTSVVQVFDRGGKSISAFKVSVDEDMRYTAESISNVNDEINKLQYASEKIQFKKSNKIGGYEETPPITPPAPPSNNLPLIYEDIKIQLAETEQKIRELEERDRSLKDQLSSTPEGTAAYNSLNEEISGLGKSIEATKDEADLLKVSLSEAGKIEMGELRSQLAAAQSEMRNALSSGNAKLVEETAAKISDISDRMRNINSELNPTVEKSVRFRTQMMLAREEMMKMISEGKMGSKEFMDLAQSSGKMRKEMSMAQAYMGYFSNLHPHLTAIKDGLQGIAGTMSLVTGVFGLFNEESKKMQELQTRIQSLMGIMVGLEKVFALLKETSNVNIAWKEFTGNMPDASGTEADTAAKLANAEANDADTSAQEANTTASEANAASKNANAGATTTDTASTNANTTAEGVNTAAERANTAATTTNTVAKNTNTAATTKGGLVAKITAASHGILTAVLGGVKTAYNAATVAAKNFTRALLKNPIGAILVGLTSLITAFTMFSDDEEEVTDDTIQFGNEVDEAQRKLQKLFDTVESSAKGSRAYKEAMDGIVKTANELGIPIDEDKAKVEGLSDAMKEFIKNKQAYQTALQAKDNARKTYDDKVKSKKEEAVKSLEGIISDSEFLGTGLLDNRDVPDDIRIKLRENASALANAYFDAYQEALEKRKETGDATISPYVEANNAFTDKAYSLGITDSDVMAAEVENDKSINDIFQSASDSISSWWAALDEENKKNELTIELNSSSSQAVAALATEIENLNMMDTSQINQVFEDINTYIGEALVGLNGLEGTISDITESDADIKLNIDGILDALNVTEEVKKELMALSATEFRTRLTQIIETKHVETFSQRYDSATTDAERKKVENQLGWFVENAQDNSQAKAQAQALQDRIKSRHGGKKSGGGKTAAQIFNEKQDQEQKEKESEEKYAKERAKAQEKYEKEVVDAKIKAMSDGGKRVLAEMDSQNKNELESLKENYENLIEAEKSRQKDKFEASESQKAKENKNYKKKLWDDSMYDSNYENGLKEKYEIIVKYTEIAQTQSNAKSLKEMLAEYDGGVQIDIDLESSSSKVTEVAGRFETLQKKLEELKNTDLSKLTDEEKKLLDIDTSKLSQAVTLMKELERINLRQKAQEDFRAKLEGYSSYYEQRRQMEEDANNAIDKMNARLASENLSAEEKTRLEIAIQVAKDQLKQGLADLDFEEWQKSINWDDLFNNLEVKSVSALKAIEEQLLTMLNSEKLTAEQAKTLADQLSQVRDLQIEKSAPFAIGGAMGNLKEARRAYKDVSFTQNDVRFKEADKAARSADRTNAKGEAQYQKALKSLVPVLKDGKEEFITYEEYLERARKAQGDLTDAQMKMQSAVQKAGKDLSSIGDIGKKAFGIAEKLGADTSSYEAQSAMTALDGLSQMGSALSSLDFSNPMSFLNVSAYMDMASGLIDTITGVLGIFGVGKGNMAELQEEIDKLTDSNATLTTALDDLADEMADASVGYAGSVYDRQMQVLGQILDNDRKILQDTAAQWERGSHSIASQVNKSASDALHRMGFSSLQQFLSADAETLKHLRAYATDDYNAVLSAIRQAENEHTGEDLEGKLNTYLDDAEGKAEDILSAYQEKVTGISFDSMYDNFKAKLKDMSTSASDFADDFKAYLNDAVVEGLADNYKDRLQKWYGKFADAAKNGLTENEKALLLAEKDQIIQDAVRERDELVKAGVLSDDTTSNASGTTKGFAGMSQSTAEELNGRFAQLQISGQQTANNTGAILGILQSQTQETTIDEVNTAFDSLSGVMNTSLHLQNQSLLELRGINQNTLESMRILGETRDLVTEIRNKTSNL